MVKFRKGFTLIELLVVIAIIGVLASIVLTSVNSARNKAKDSSIKGSLAALKSAGEMYADANGNYNNFCSGTEAVKAQTAINNIGGANTWSCGSAIAGWAACGNLVADSANSFCVDASGNSKIIIDANCDGLAAGATVCP